MRNLLIILIVATFMGIILYYTFVGENSSEVLKGPNIPTQAIPSTEVEKTSMYLPRPIEGVSTLIGSDADLLLKQFGPPTRIEKSRYQYDWWVYVKDKELLMISVEDNKVTQVYTNSSKHNIAPYTIGQSLEEIYRMTIVESEIAVTIDETIYLFLMNEEDLNTRLLVAFEDVFAQLYLDYETNKLIGIRFIDGPTLVRHRPYEFQYIGELIQHTVPSSFEQSKIDLAYSNQIYNLVNEFRLLNNVPKLLISPLLNEIAMEHSEYMVLKDLNINADAEIIPIESRLEEKNMTYKKVDVNSAIHYYDAIEAVHGWINSKEHRDILFNKRYNMSGTGVYLNKYIQVYIEKETSIDY